MDKIKENINQEEVINNFELISTDNYKLISKTVFIKDNKFYLENTNIYFDNIHLFSSKSIIENEKIYLTNLCIKSINFTINSKKSFYKNKIFKLEKVKAKF
jgi:hypothetical protein